MCHLKGNKTRYALNGVRSIQSGIFLTGSTCSTCERTWCEMFCSVLAAVLVQAKDLLQKTLLRPEWWCLFTSRTMKSSFRASWTCNLTQELIPKLKESGWHACDREKTTKERAKKCSWREKLMRIIWYCATFGTCFPKKMYMCCYRRCPWLTESSW